jgi:hypothetical protein
MRFPALLTKFEKNLTRESSGDHQAKRRKEEKTEARARYRNKAGH